MRLIDADKLNYVEDGHYIGHGMYEGHYDVSNAPTVDAIPVKWIEQQIKKLKNGYGPYGLIDYIEWMDCLRSIIDEWREINEQRKNR